MAEGRAWSNWNYAASIEATLANTVRDPKRRRRPYKAREFHPIVCWHVDQQRRRMGDQSAAPAPVSILKAVFVDGAPLDKIIRQHETGAADGW